MTIVGDAKLTCPGCGGQHECRMPEDACVYFWDCPTCGVRLKPKAGDCCVFCSYGSSPCPPVQAQNSGLVAPRREGRLTGGDDAATSRRNGHQPD
ncbi:MAG TPA: GDCCVxC domain-containing (seleno)protein [Alphaproteobacteria bacterium]|nr:GDCCVxC domain-containing (seleno)protein [Alphaproteobacteria bacterium]